MSAEYKWKKEDIVKLIQLYEGRSVLWNISLADYKNRSKKEQALDEIAEELKITKNSIKTKWHNLRCQFNGEMRKIKGKKSGQGSDDNYISHWDYFDALKFLTGVNGESKNAIDNLGSDNISTENELSLEIDSILSDCAGPSSPSPSVDMKTTGKKRKTSMDLQREAVLKKAMSIMEKPNDDIQNFCDYLGSQIRQLSKTKQQKLQRIIQAEVWKIMDEPDNCISNVGTSEPHTEN